MRSIFKKVFFEVFMVISDFFGVGKTEVIYEYVVFRKKKIVIILISGFLSRKYLVKRLLGLIVGFYECIYFDVGEVDDFLVFDILMFEFVVVGMLFFGIEFFYFLIKYVYIEIANILRYWL